MYKSDKKLLILDADGTTIDAFSAIEAAFAHHGLVIGDETRFQKRHKLLKYMGGLKEFPSIIRKNLRKNSRAQLIDTLTGIYRQEARLYDGIADLIRELIAAPDITVGIVTRNVTIEPLETLRQLFLRHDIDIAELDFLVHIPSRTPRPRSFAPRANSSASTRRGPSSAATSTRTSWRRSAPACTRSWSPTASNATTG
ncbi:HAD family hydrolase [Massilia oculi]|uniref:HAD family hydrolase n=1 Tax=Massilia oculi TaxID=945844 RepID=UPI001E38E58A|nr:hypothetical protein [Massilia oculi]